MKILIILMIFIFIFVCLNLPEKPMVKPTPIRYGELKGIPNSAVGEKRGAKYAGGKGVE